MAVVQLLLSDWLSAIIFVNVVAALICLTYRISAIYLLRVALLRESKRLHKAVRLVK